MSDARIPTEFFVTASLRKCQSENIPVYVSHRGDPHSGMIVLKILNADFKCRILTQMRDMDGELKWFDKTGGIPLAENEADQHIRSAIDRDPDLWVVEIETRDGQNPFDGKNIQL